MSTLYERVQRGIDNRRTRLTNLMAHGSRDHDVSPHPAPRLDRRSHTSSSSAGEIDLTLFSQRFLEETTPLRDYLATVQRIVPKNTWNIFVSYYFTARFVPISSCEECFRFFDTFTSLSDAQLSIVVETTRIHHDYLEPELQRLVDSGRAQLLNQLRPKEAIRCYDDFKRWLAELLPSKKPPAGISTPLLKFIRTAREPLVHIIGPDLFTAFESLFDHNAQYDGSLLSIDFASTVDWNCHELFTLLALGRFSGGFHDYNIHSHFLLTQLETRRDSFSDELLALAAEWTWKRPYNSARASAPLASLSHYTRLTADIEREAAEEIYQDVIALYNSDVIFIPWLDWPRIYRLIRFAPRKEGMIISAFYLIMAIPAVLSRFPTLKMKVGQATFESALRSAMKAANILTLYLLVDEIASLEGATQKLFVDAIIESHLAIMLSKALSYDPPNMKHLTSLTALAYDARASGFRMDLVAALCQRRPQLLTREAAQKIHAEESSRLRVAYLQGRQLNGLVQIDWKAFSETLHPILRALFSIVGKISTESRRTEVFDTIADSITKFFLITGPDDIKTTISTSLRHNQLPNRFLAAFDDAIVHSLARHIDVEEFITEIKSGRTGKTHWALFLREKLTNCVETFNTKSLDVGISSEFAANVKTISVAFVKGYLLDQKTPAPDTGGLVEAIKTRLDELLRRAQGQLSAALADYQKLCKAVEIHDPTLVETVDIDPRYAAPINISTFLNRLTESLQEALSETTKWIALTSFPEDPEAFQLMDIVQLCLLNYRLRTTRETNIKVIVSLTSKQHGVVSFKETPWINGKYFRVLEITINNLISNVVKHGGLGLRSRVELELIDSKGMLTVRCRNTLSGPRLRQSVATVGALRERLKIAQPAKAKLDKGSGLPKIIWGWNKAFGHRPNVNIRVMEKTAEFVVEITGRHSHDSILGKA
jgi:hypothetical protein